MPENSYDTPTKARPSPTPAGQDNFPVIQGGRYILDSVIGAGGAGSVYKALDNSLNKHVAIKILHTASDEQTIRFQREARLAGALKHENIVSVIDFGITERNEPYLVLDYVEGESLSEYIARKGSVPIDQALHILIQIADGLHYAHKNGVIHRDIKPSNVILVADKGERIAKIVDFGLAKSLNDAQYLTQTGVGMGTPKYMSPEHARGILVDQRSDIYSFGCLMFETLTGRAPFRAETAVETIELHMSKQPPKLAEAGLECDTELEQIIDRCLQKNPAARFQSVSAVRERLSTALENFEQSQFETAPESSEAEFPNATTKKTTRWIARACMTLFFAGLVLYEVHSINSHPVEVLPKTKASKNPNLRVQGALKELPKGSIYLQDDIDDIWNADGATDKDLREFLKTQKKKNKLQRFDLSASNISRSGFELLGKNSELTFLEYSDQPLNDETISKVIQLNSLKELRLGNTKIVDGKSLAKLAKLPALSLLTIGGTALDDSAFEAISKLDRLTMLDLPGCTGVTPEGLTHLSTMQNLEQIRLGGTDIDDRAIEPLSKIASLSFVSLKRTRITGRYFERFTQMPRINSLDIQENPQFTEALIQELKDKVKKNKLGSQIELCTGDDPIVRGF